MLELRFNESAPSCSSTPPAPAKNPVRSGIPIESDAVCSKTMSVASGPLHLWRLPPLARCVHLTSNVLTSRAAAPRTLGPRPTQTAVPDPRYRGAISSPPRGPAPRGSLLLIRVRPTSRRTALRSHHSRLRALRQLMLRYSPGPGTPRSRLSPLQCPRLQRLHTATPQAHAHA